MGVPPFNEVQRKVKLAALDQEFIIYTPVASIRVRASPTFGSWHEGAEGTSATFYVLIDGTELCNTAPGMKNILKDLTTIPDLLYLKNLKRPKFLINCSTERYGTEYGGWVFCPTDLTKTSIVYSLGIGEDTSWDEELIAKHGLEVFGFDPTPKSAIYVQQRNLSKFNFFQIGVADRNGSFDFYPPKNRSDPIIISPLG